jgi:hypothetical protein
MTVVAVLADPPREGLVLPELSRTAPISPAEAATLYRAMLQDVVLAVDRSGADLLVNYRPDESLPDEYVTGTASEAAVRAVVAEALADPSTARYERQVGSTPSARAGNTVTHLLREEGERTAAIVRPTAPFLTRAHVDSAAMKLRNAGVVLQPAPDGRVGYAGFAAPIDFEGTLGDGALETLTDRGRAADLGVDFLPFVPVVETGSDLKSALPLLGARVTADRLVPERTARLVAEWGLGVEYADGGGGGDGEDGDGTGRGTDGRSRGHAAEGAGRVVRE